MATVEQVAVAALKRILVQDSTPSLDGEDYDDFIFTLNNYMTGLDADGIALGYTIVANLSDIVTVPTGALRGVIANMAIECAPDYGGVVSDALVLAAKQGLETMRMLGQTIPTSVFPSTLPVGSGNWLLNGGLGNNYYPDQETDILRETTGAIALELQTK